MSTLPIPHATIVSQTNTNCNTYLTLQVPHPTQAQEKESFIDKITRFEQKKTAAEDIQSILVEKYIKDGNAAKAHNIEMCGSYILFRRYQDPEKTTKVIKANLCRHPLCPFCSWRKHLKQSLYISKALEGMQNLYFVTLTINNIEDITKDDVSVLIKNSTTMLRKVLGCKDYIANLEITNKGKGFHPHIHAIVKADGWTNAYISKSMSYWRKEWGKINNANLGYNILQIEKITDADGAVQEISKYITKIQIDTDGVVLKNVIEQLIPTIHGVRQIRSAGEIKKRIAAAKDATKDEDREITKMLQKYDYTDIVAQWLQGHYTIRFDDK